MKKTTYIWCRFLGIASFCTIVSSNVAVSAQVTPDNTLPNNSEVKVEGNKSTIEGGTTAGSNLFHSFEKFGVRTGGEAHFNNAADIQNIIGRVTGKSISEIDGLIKANGSANLFLINPNGIVFGENARLDIGGSFVGSTADSFKFTDGKEFSATKPQEAPLLTMNVPVGLQYGANPGNIQVKGDGQGIRKSSSIIDTQTGLRVQPNQTLALVGGDVSLEGATLKTAGGRIELASVKGESLVNLTPTQKGFSLGYDAVGNGGNIELSKQAAVDASGEGAGDIQVWGKNIKITDDSQIEASTLGLENGGNLVVNAQESVEVIGTSNKFGTALSASVYSEATGKSGDLRAGNLIINTDTLLVKDGGILHTSTFGSGRGGYLIVNAENVEFIGNNSLNVSSALLTSPLGGIKRDAGDVVINTGTLLVKDGAMLSTSTISGGKGGNLTVNADNVEFIGRNSANDSISTLFTSTLPGTKGNAGDVVINTDTLLVKDGAILVSGTFGGGKAGNITVNASKSVQLIGGNNVDNSPNGLIAMAGEDTTLPAGDLTINTGELLIRDIALLSVGNLGKGIAGNLNISADSVQLDEGFITATTRSNNGGNITLNIADLLLMRNRSQISATAGIDGAAGNGGNIDINIPNGFIIATPKENNNITANAFEGNGGRVKIDAAGIYGMTPRSREDLVNLLGTNDPKEVNALELPTNDITAISQQNPDLGGTIEIITPETDPTSGSNESPTIPVDTEIVDACSSKGYAQSSFTITGTGNLPRSPFDPLTGSVTRTKLATLEGDGEIKPQARQRRQARKEEPQITQIVEARGWVRTKDGKIILTASSPQKTNFQPRTNSGNCKLIK